MMTPRRSARSRLETLAAHVVGTVTAAAAGRTTLEAERADLEARLRVINAELHEQGAHPGPLAGITVIEAQQAITGPLGTMMLADMGATVIKIESPSGPGDVNRPSGVRMPDHEEQQRGDHSAYYHNFNRGKRCIALDLTTKEGQGVLQELVKTADIFCQNARPGAADRNGYGYGAGFEADFLSFWCDFGAFGMPGALAFGDSGALRTDYIGSL